MHYAAILRWFQLFHTAICHRQADWQIATVGQTATFPPLLFPLGAWHGCVPSVWIYWQKSLRFAIIQLNNFSFHSGATAVDGLYCSLLSCSWLSRGVTVLWRLPVRSQGGLIKSPASDWFVQRARHQHGLSGVLRSLRNNSSARLMGHR